MANGKDVLPTSGQTKRVTFGSGGVVGVIGTWGYQAFHAFVPGLASAAFIDANAGFMETSATLCAFAASGLARLAYAWLRPKLTGVAP